MEQIAFWVFILAGAYMIIGEAIFRVRRNTKKGKRAEEIMGVKAARIFNLAMGLLLIGLGFIWYF